MIIFVPPPCIIDQKRYKIKNKCRSVLEMFKIKYSSAIYTVYSIFADDPKFAKFLIFQNGKFEWVYASMCELVEGDNNYV